jgi:hypothetical protein
MNPLRPLTSTVTLADDDLPRATARRAPAVTFRARRRAVTSRFDLGTSTRMPRGWMRNLIGVGMSSASPSTPAKAEPARDLTSKDSQVNSCQPGSRPRNPTADAAMSRAASDPEAALTAKTPRVPVSILRRWETSTDGPSTYGLLDTMMRKAPLISMPSGVVNCRSKGSAVIPSISGSSVLEVSRLASR